MLQPTRYKFKDGSILTKQKAEEHFKSFGYSLEDGLTKGIIKPIGDSNKIDPQDAIKGLYDLSDEDIERTYL